MKKIFVGVDLIEVNRIQESINRWGERFLNRIYSKSELEIFKGKIQSLAVRFAAKEAAMKALSNETIMVGWKEIEILAEPSGKPVIILHGNAEQRACELGLERLEVSLSHTRDNAIAIVIGIQED